MTVARDAVLESATFTTTTPHTFTFTPAGTPKAIVLFVVYPSVTDLITGTVSYGGVAMTRIPTNGLATVTGEPGSVVGYTLGTGIPTGAQTVSIGHTGSADVKIAYVESMTAAADTEIAVSGKVQTESGISPQVALDSGAASALRCCGVFSGESAASGLTALSGMETLVAGTTHDFGANIAGIGQQTTASTGSFTIGFTSAGNESHALVAVAIQEVSTAVTGTIAVTQVDQVGALTGTVANPITGTIAVTQAAQTMAATGTETFTGTIGATQADQTGALAGTVANPVTGTIGATQAANTGALSGTVGPAPITGTIAAIQVDQTGAFTGTLGIIGMIGVGQDPNVGAFTGLVANPVTGTIGATQDDNDAAFLGTIVSDGTLNSIQDAQTATFTGTVSNPVTGTIGVTQQDQTGVFTGTHTPPAVTGTISVTQDDQTATFTGIAAFGVVGILGAVQDDQTGSFTGVALSAVTGTIAAVQADQTAAFTGTVTVNVTGVLATIQANQTTTFTGSVANSASTIVGGSCVLGGPTAGCTISPVVIVAGSNVQITTTFRDANGDLADPSSISAVVQAPDGTQSTPTPTSSSVGIWVTTIPTDQAGYWFYQITGAGSEIDVVCQGSFCAEASLILV